ncbi:hypothetical protein TI04_10100 [Achromatium sp. WMS2]|nr:hypothetical protein TI04_10100 [Achromatium sp. WMS2]
MFNSPRMLDIQLRDALLFSICYVILDWASYIHPLDSFNITPWNPPPALSIIWMMLDGVCYTPILFLTIFFADIIIRQAPGGILVTALTSIVLATGYAAIAAALRRLFRSDMRLHDIRRLWIFVLVPTFGIALISILYIGILWFYDFFPSEHLLEAMFQFWLGDVVGILVVTPPLLVVVEKSERSRLIELFKNPEVITQFIVMAATVLLVFEWFGSDPSKFFYLPFLPLIWVALRGGLPGTAMASVVIQIGVVLGAHGGAIQMVALIELQALVIALTLTGLFLGVIVDEWQRAIEEREQAVRGLDQSLRLAAAGEMAGAIAHEINQPLAALTNYSKVCQIILQRHENTIPTAEIQTIMDKIANESKRAAEVVGRLRDLFRTGTTHLEPVTVNTLMEKIRGLGAKFNTDNVVDFQVGPGWDTPPLLVDRIQIELILRNLIHNAFDAVSTLPTKKRKVAVTVNKLENGGAIFYIQDSGPGVPINIQDQIFKPFFSNKTTGMGLGLAISKDIIEAHGGSLTVTAGKNGKFSLMIPGYSND